jgi:acetyl esterase/lipase
MIGSNLQIGEGRDRELLQNAETFCYKETAAGSLLAHVYDDKLNATPAKPMLIFFHGGFWDTSAISQFATQALHFMGRGCVALLAETRVKNKHQSTPLDAIQDASELIIGAKKNADQLGIDPQKIILVGSAGGAYLALQAAMQTKPPTIDGFDPVPAAVIALSALVNTCPGTEHAAKFPNAAAAKNHSPSKLIRKKLPPMLFLHGKNDHITPLSHVLSFRRWMKWKGNRIDVIEYEAADHRFFNFNVSHAHHDRALAAMEHFLLELDLIDVPKNDAFIE